MKKVFIDANILVDYLSKRTNKEDHTIAMDIIYRCHNFYDKAFISSHSLMVLFHIVEKEFEDKAVLKLKLQAVYNLFNIVAVTNQDFHFAFDSYMSDFEDAVQLSCALKMKADFLVTKDAEDFYGTDLPLVLPDQFYDFI